MKKLLLFAVLLAFAGNSSAQDNSQARRGYLGISIGPALPSGDIGNHASSGGQLALNFGYISSGNVGFAAKLFGSLFSISGDSNVSMGGIVLGPLISVPLADRVVEFDITPMIGLAKGTSDIIFGSYTSNSTGLAFGAGGAFRWNCGRNISASFGVDYLHFVPGNSSLASFGIMFGLNYRLK